MSELTNEIRDLLTAAGAAPDDLPTEDEVAEKVPSFYDNNPRQATLRLLAERLRCTDLYCEPNEITDEYRWTAQLLDKVIGTIDRLNHEAAAKRKERERQIGIAKSLIMTHCPALTGTEARALIANVMPCFDENEELNASVIKIYALLGHRASPMLLDWFIAADSDEERARLTRARDQINAN